MELRIILKSLRAFTFMGVVILVSLKSTEGSDIWCPRKDFHCIFSCRSDSVLCNGVKDCGDGTDEKYCNITDPSFSCPVDILPWFMCSDKTRCYPRHLRCNGFINCRDGSDEIGCDFEPISVPGAFEADQNSTKILLVKKNDHPTIKYGQHITKVALAISSSNRFYLKTGSRYAKPEIADELSLQLMSKLALKKKISTYELSQYINALLVTCIDPRDFFGVNLVSELRKRVNQSNQTNPFTILTLCNARDTMILEDVRKLQNIFDAPRRPLWAATQSLATMAMACISSHSSLEVDERIILDMVRQLKRKQYRNGTVENLRTTALVVQALLATDTYQTEFDIRSAVKLLVDKVQSKDLTIQDIYYFMPVFNHMSLADISSDHCEKQTKTELEMLKSMEDFPDGHIQVPFSVYIGNEKHFVRTWKLRVPATYNFYQVLEIVSTVEPVYKITYSTSNGKPYVISVGNFTEDAEVGKFWFIYTQTLSSPGNFTLIEKKLDFHCPSYYYHPSLNGDCHYNEYYCTYTYEMKWVEKYCNITDPTIVCPVTDLPWFMCLDKKRCYPRQLRCDGKKNCKDDSDEIGCDAEPMKDRREVYDTMRSLTEVLLHSSFNSPATKSSPRISKIAIALSSTDRRLLKPNTKTRDEIANELSLQLLNKLTLKKKISTYELSDYINALIVTCINPRDFFGFNLVGELRKRVNQSNYTNPYTVLTLCNARDTMVMEDVLKLQNMFYAHLRSPWTDTQSFATMALACISSHSSLQIDERIIPEMVKELKRKQMKNGTIESLWTTALVVQALLATESYKTEFNVQTPVKLMLDKVKSRPVHLQDIYYILPVLNHMSLADISYDHCGWYNERTDFEKPKNLQDFPAEVILVQFSLYIGEKKDFVKNWNLKVPTTSNLYQILEIISILEPKYKVNYTVTNGKPYVTSVGNVNEDAEVGVFWFIYKQPLSLEENLILIKESPVDVPVKATEELILWYKTGDWYPSIDTLN